MIEKQINLPCFRNEAGEVQKVMICGKGLKLNQEIDMGDSQ